MTARRDGHGKLLVRVDAGNDCYGNPRRGWLVYTSEGNRVAYVDEGYYGQEALRLAGYEHATELSGVFRVTAREWRAMRKGERDGHV
jgi:hypothetical protein